MTDLMHAQQQYRATTPQATWWPVAAATGPAGSTPHAHADRRVVATASQVRRAVVATLRTCGFRIDTEQLTAVLATRGSHLAGLSTQLDKLTIAAIVRFTEDATGCWIAIDLVDRRAAGVSRMVGAEGHFRAAFEQVIGALDNALGILDPVAREEFPAAQYSCRTPAAAPVSRGGGVGTKLNKMLTGPGSGPGSRSWHADGATFTSPQGMASVDIEMLQTMATVGTQIVDHPDGATPEQVARISELVAMLDLRLGASSGAARIDLTEEQATVVSFLWEQARIRQVVEMRTRQRCLACGMEKIVNPDYKAAIRKATVTRTLGNSVGAIIGKGGINPVVMFGRLVQLKQLDPDYVCPRCQGMHAESVMITFCPQCHERHDESALRGCRKCGYDFGTAVPAASVWQEATADSALDAAPIGWYPDPSGTDQLRWWDGEVWTEHLHPYDLAGER